MGHSAQALRRGQWEVRAKIIAKAFKRIMRGAAHSHIFMANGDGVVISDGGITRLLGPSFYEKSTLWRDHLGFLLAS
jgi:hypothetical protein